MTKGVSKSQLKADFCVIGAGSGGLSLAAGAVQMGASVILLEANKMGGDCLNFGCVPSKSILRVAKFYAEKKKLSQLGWMIDGVKHDFKQGMEHVHQVIKKIEPHDSVERFEKLGVKVITEAGYFVDTKTVATESYNINAKYFVIATGSRPAIPPIKGLDKINYLTNETIFNLQELPKKLIVIGGGPIGIEMAQAFHRLGSKVTVLEAFNALAKDDQELTSKLIDLLVAEGLHIEQNINIEKVLEEKGTEQAITVRYTNKDAKAYTLQGTHLLIASGRLANIDKLQLDKAGIKSHNRGIIVNDYLQTTNKRVYAIGDCLGQLQFTHLANHHAGIVIRNAIFKLKTKPSNVVPWVTYTDPEIANVGLNRNILQQKGIAHESYTIKFDGLDRAVAEKAIEGQAVINLNKKGKILGVTILGQNAGELIYPWVIAMENNLKIGAIAKSMAAYPTFSDINKQLAGKYYTPRIFSTKMQKIVKFMLKYFS